MSEHKARVLLMRETEELVGIIKRSLDDSIEGMRFELQAVDSVDEVLNQCHQADADIVLCEFNEPSKEALSEIRKIRDSVKRVPIVVLTDSEEQILRLHFIHWGARDCVARSEALCCPKLLSRVVRFAIERQQIHEELTVTRGVLASKPRIGTMQQLAAGVAHQIRNPLQVIQTGVDLLKTAEEQREESEREEERMAVLETLCEAINRADAVVQDLSALSQPGKLERNLADVNQIIEKALRAVRQRADLSSISVMTALAHELPSIHLDSRHMQTVFESLLDKAVSAVSDGGQVLVKTYRQAMPEHAPMTGHRRSDRFAPGEDVIISEIHDTGTDIPEDQLTAMMDPLLTATYSESDTTVSLAVAQNIIELHGGMAAVGHSPSGGMMIRLFLKVEK